MNRVHFRNGVWHVVRDWRVIDAAPLLSDLLSKEPVWVSTNLDSTLPAVERRRLLAFPGSGLGVQASSHSTSLAPSSFLRMHLEANGRLTRRAREPRS